MSLLLFSSLTFQCIVELRCSADWKEHNNTSPPGGLQLRERQRGGRGEAAAALPRGAPPAAACPGAARARTPEIHDGSLTADVHLGPHGI